MQRCCEHTCNYKMQMFKNKTILSIHECSDDDIAEELVSEPQQPLLMNLIRFQLNLSYISLKGFLKMYLRALCYCTDSSSGVPNRAALLRSVSWHKVMENRKPVHPSSPHCRSLLQMCIGHTPLNPLLCVFVWQGCCRGSPPSRTSWTRWCQSSTRTLRPSSWTLKAERVPRGAMETDSNL